MDFDKVEIIPGDNKLNVMFNDVAIAEVSMDQERYEKMENLLNTVLYGAKDSSELQEYLNMIVDLNAYMMSIFFKLAATGCKGTFVICDAINKVLIEHGNNGIKELMRKYDISCETIKQSDLENETLH